MTILSGISAKPIATLDCQTCGQPIRQLSPAEEKAIKSSPFSFVIDCSKCTDEWLAIGGATR